MFSHDFNFGFERWVISNFYFACLIILLWESVSKLDGTAHLWKCK